MRNASIPAKPVNIAFFSRGRGRGHVVPDIALLEELRRLDPNVRTQWISYGTGADVLRERGYEVDDLSLPDENPFLETELRSIRVLARLRPDLIISHEEYSAAPAANLLGAPMIFITDYFVAAEHLWMQCLRYADRILFMDEAGHFDPPPFLREKTVYTGPLIRNLTYSRADRIRARKVLGIPEDDTLLLCLPGSWFTEDRAPLFELVTTAFRHCDARNKRLVWIAAADYPDVSRRALSEPGVTVRRNDGAIDPWMAACDLAITKGTRKTSLELASLGVPIITLSPGQNPIDDRRVQKIPGNSYVVAHEIASGSLADLITQRLRDRGSHTGRSHLPASGLAAAAAIIAETVKEVRARLERNTASAATSDELSKSSQFRS